MIRLEGLRVQAGEFSLAIDDLSVRPGEYLMILGPTASGKTVLLETIAGLRRSKAGRIWFGERDVTGHPPERRRVGLVYQDYALFPHLTVAGNIGFGVRARGEASPVRELAGLLGIDGLVDRYPEGLSGGERQRVALARALAIEPEVLLLDEPLAALDGPTRIELQRELKRIHRERGATVVHVTHDLDEALALGDRMAVLIDGGLRQVDSPRHVTRFPVDAGVARLVGVTNLFPVSEILEEVAGSEERLKRVQLDNGLHILGGEATLIPSADRVFLAIRADEIEVEPLESERPEVPSGWQTEGDPAWSDNQLDGLVKGLQTHSVHTAIDVEIPAVLAGTSPSVFTVHVLRSNVDRIGLVVGSRVRLRIPSSAVHLCPEAGSMAGGR